MQHAGQKSREVWVDIAKSICIIAMVMGHCGSPATIYIYMFHMPAFLFLSGYTYGGERYTWLQYTKRKFLTLVVPLFAINALFIAFYKLASALNFYSYINTPTYSGFWNGIKMLFSPNIGATEMGGATWFLIVLFFAEVIFKAVQQLVNRSKWDIFVAAVIAGVGYMFIQNQRLLPFTLDLGLYAVGFFAAGVLFKRYGIFETINRFGGTGISFVSVYCFGRFYFAGRLPMNWPTRAFDNPLVQFASVFACIYLLYIAASAIRKWNWGAKRLSYIGRHTFTILTLHFFVFRALVASLVLLRVLPAASLSVFPIAKELLPYWLFVSILTVALCALISWIAEKNRVLNYLLNAIPPKGSGRFSDGCRILGQKLDEKPTMRYAAYALILCAVYFYVLRFIIPGHIAPLVPHHSDILDYPYDIIGYGPIGVFLHGARPVGLILTWFFGLFGGYKGVMITGALITFSAMLLTLYCSEKEIGRRPWWVAVLFYALLVVSSPSFYLNYTFDLYNVYGIFFSMLTFALWYKTYGKTRVLLYLLVFVLGLCNFLCKETYIISVCFFFFAKIFLEKGEMRKKALWFCGLSVLAACVSMLQARLANSVFSAMKITDSTSPYFSTFELFSLLKTAKYYLQALNNPWVLLILFLSCALLVRQYKHRSIGIFALALSGVFAYVPYLVLPNRIIPHSFFISYTLAFAPVLVIDPKAIGKLFLLQRKRAAIIILGLFVVVFKASVAHYNASPSYNSYLYTRAWTSNESAMRLTLDTVSQVNDSLEPNDNVLVTGVEEVAETAYRPYHADEMFRKDAHFYVVTNHKPFTGTFAPNVTYIDTDMISDHTYTVHLDYADGTAKITRVGK